MVSRLLNYLKSFIWVKREEKEFDKRNFKKIDGEVSRVFAIDGGNALICDGGTWTISKVKTAVVGYNNGKRTMDKVFFDLFLLIRKNGEIILNNDMKLPVIKLKNIKFEDAPSEVRKILEYMTAIEIVKDLEIGDTILLDSLLKPDYDFQKEILNDLIRKADEKGVSLLGIAKTSRISTRSGRSFIGLLNEVGSDEFPWYYHPISDEKTKYKDLVAKFHAKSKYCYRCNLLGNMNALVTAVFYSNDAELLGYPYPLLRADKIGRITSHEKEAERRNISVTAKRMGLENIDYDILSQDMHSRLDKRMYR